MSTLKPPHLLMAALLTLGITAFVASEAMASEAGGSALPPGINPSSPAGGNGGDAQGYEKKTLNPEPAGTAKKAVGKQSPARHTSPSKSDRTHSIHKKASPSQP